MVLYDIQLFLRVSTVSHKKILWLWTICLFTIISQRVVLQCSLSHTNNFCALDDIADYFSCYHMLSIPGTNRKKKLVGLERGALSLVSTNWGATW
jgi:hypothetical protein